MFYIKYGNWCRSAATNTYLLYGEKTQTVQRIAQPSPTAPGRHSRHLVLHALENFSPGLGPQSLRSTSLAFPAFRDMPQDLQVTSMEVRKVSVPHFQRCTPDYLWYPSLEVGHPRSKGGTMGDVHLPAKVDPLCWDTSWSSSCPSFGDIHFCSLSVLEGRSSQILYILMNVQVPKLIGFNSRSASLI